MVNSTSALFCDHLPIIRAAKDTLVPVNIDALFEIANGNSTDLYAVIFLLILYIKIYLFFIDFVLFKFLYRLLFF